jgi:hypothetical protein
MTTVSPHGPGQLSGFVHLSESPYTWTSIRRPPGGRLPDMTAAEFGPSRGVRIIQASRMSYSVHGLKLSYTYVKTTFKM